MPKTDVNLLPKDDFEFTPMGKFVTWSLSVGKWVIVFTLLIVICAFLSRFYFDTENSQLFDEIYQKEQILSVNGNFEEEFIKLQQKINTVKVILSQTRTPSVIMVEIGRMMPLDVTLNSVMMNPNVINIAGYSLSENGLKTFLNEIKKYPRAESIAFCEFSQKDLLYGTKFNIQISLKK